MWLESDVFNALRGPFQLSDLLGGLRDSVRDISEPNGVGIRFDEMHFDHIMHAVWRANELFYKPEWKTNVSKCLSGIRFSWESGFKIYDIPEFT